LTTAPYLFIASMNVDPAHEVVFNDVYDTEHIPALSNVPGVLSVVRYEKVELRMAIDRKVQTITSDHPYYSAVYAVESPEVLASPKWADAVEAGRWPKEVRPHTLNRRHVLVRRRSDERA
jgi:hypothetical protein